VGLRPSAPTDADLERLGGLPYGMVVAEGTDGTVCTGVAGRVVGDRVGGVDFALDVLRGETTAGACGPPPRGGRGGAPFSFSTTWAGGLGLEEAEDPASGRVARRTLPRRVIVAGTAAAEVRHLTLQTPSDTRTVSPTGPARAFLVVYAGDIAAGRITVTTTFRDGSTRRDTFSGGF